MTNQLICAEISQSKLTMPETKVSPMIINIFIKKMITHHFWLKLFEQKRKESKLINIICFFNLQENKIPV